MLASAATDPADLHENRCANVPLSPVTERDVRCVSTSSEAGEPASLTQALMGARESLGDTAESAVTPLASDDGVRIRLEYKGVQA